RFMRMPLELCHSNCWVPIFHSSLTSSYLDSMCNIDGGRMKQPPYYMHSALKISGALYDLACMATTTFLESFYRVGTQTPLLTSSLLYCVLRRRCTSPNLRIWKRSNRYYFAVRQNVIRRDPG